jgi:protein TonB
MDRPTRRIAVPLRPPADAVDNRRIPPRRSLSERRDLERRQARRRIAGTITTRLAPEQLAFDPLGRDRQQRRRRVWIGLLAVLGSAALHVGVVGSGLGWRWIHTAAPARDEVKIEVRERPPEVKPEPPPPPPPPPVEKPIARPEVAKALPPPEAPPPKEPPKAKPMRVVGLSLESTNGTGDGPSFAVGNTRMGETAKKAVAPEAVPPPSVEAPPVAAPSGPAASNQVASRIPVAGVKYSLPKRRNPKKPPYPTTLKSQGIEADVTVLVTISAEGKVTSVKLIKEAPYPEFNQAARQAALDEEFEPAARDGVPIPYTLSFTYRFRLEDE